MRRRISSLATTLLLVLTATPSQSAESFAVTIDQSAAISLPAGAQKVMIGNPAIADINVIDARTAVLLGRSFGATNVLVLDARGRTLMERQIVVSAPDANRISVYHSDPLGLYGQKVENFTCSPRCERTPMPGEPEIDYNRYGVGYVAYNARATDARTSGGSAKPAP